MMKSHITIFLLFIIITVSSCTELSIVEQEYTDNNGKVCVDFSKIINNRKISSNEIKNKSNYSQVFIFNEEAFYYPFVDFNAGIQILDFEIPPGNYQLMVLVGYKKESDTKNEIALLATSEKVSFTVLSNETTNVPIIVRPIEYEFDGSKYLINDLDAKYSIGINYNNSDLRLWRGIQNLRLWEYTNCGYPRVTHYLPKKNNPEYQDYFEAVVEYREIPYYANNYFSYLYVIGAGEFFEIDGLKNGETTKLSEPIVGIDWLLPTMWTVDVNQDSFNELYKRVRIRR